MAGVAAVVLAVLGLLAAVHSQQETRFEDPTTEFYVQLLKTLIASSTKSLQGALTRLEDKSAKEETITELQDSIRDVKDSISRLESSFKKIKKSMDDGVDRTRVDMRMFRDNVSQELGNLKRLVEDKSKETSKQMAELLATDCEDLYELGLNATGVYYLPRHGRDVLCEMEGGDGGWMVMQRRAKVETQVDFDVGWDEYKKGFGDVETEFWIGNDFLHVLTNQKNYQLRIDFRDYEKGPYWAAYSTFRVGNEASDYALNLGNFTGNTTDAFHYHHGRSFSTKDRDNDLFSSGNCASQFTGGWWYDRCYDAHLNGYFPVVPDRQNATFLTWWTYEEQKRVPLVLDKVTMRIKPTKV